MRPRHADSHVQELVDGELGYLRIDPILTPTIISDGFPNAVIPEVQENQRADGSSSARPHERQGSCEWRILCI